MNDSREYLHAFDVLKGALEVVWGEATIEEHVSFLEGVPEDAQRFEESNVYAVCFSEVPDLLSQWRAYCPNGSGVALGFTTGDLRDITEFQAFQLGRCIYDSKEQTEKVLYELRFYLRRLLEEENPTPAFTQRMVREFILHSFLAIAPFFKDPAFSEEREWRLVLEFVPQLKDLGFRIGGSTLTPYVKTGVAYPGETLALAQIIIGPTPHPELVVSAMDLLKAKYNLARTTLHKSTIPYRPW
jgi:hypothetical protein